MIFLFVLICYGLTQILAHGKIFNKIRPKHYYFSCPMCMGFPVGIIIFLCFWFSGIKLFLNPYLGSILFGFISSGTSYALCSLFGDNGLRINIG